MKARADFFETLKGQFITSKRLKHRLITHWGTETVDGVEVFRKHFDVYPDTDSSRVKKITKLFGIAKDLATADFGGIDRYYLKFNPRKSTRLASYSKTILTNKINSFYTIGEVIATTLNIHDPSNPSRFSGLTDAQILEFVDTNYENSLLTGYVESRGETILADTLGAYVLLDNGQHFTVNIVSAHVAPFPVTRLNNFRQPYKVYESAITLDLEITVNSDVVESSNVVTRMYAELESSREAAIKLLIEASTNKNQETLLSESDIPVTNTLFYKDQLRVETTDSSILDRNAFARLVGDSVDTGFVKKKTKWWKKILSFVLLFIALILAAPSGGASLAVFAANMAIATLVLTAIQIALAKSGDVGFATYMGNVVQVSGLISTVAGIGSMISSAASAIARQGALQAVKGYVTGLFTETVTSSASAVAVDAASSAGTQIASQTVTTSISANKVISAAFKVAMKFIGYREERKAKKVQNQIDEATRAKEQLEEDLYDLQDKSLHIGVEDIKWYTSPLSTERSQFEIDYLYEGTKYNVLRPSFYKATGLNIIDKQT